MGHPVHVAPVVEWDINITFPADILVGNLYWLDRQGHDNVIHETAKVHDGARLNRTILGPNVQIRHPIALDQVVILADTTVDLDQDLRNAVVYGEHVVSCEK